jgi:hypothetical protein
MRGEILFQIVRGELKRYLVLLQERMDLEPRFQPEETPHLRLGQSTYPVTQYGEGFQGMGDRQFHDALRLQQDE